MIKLKDILLEGKASESKYFKAIEDNLQHIAYQFAESNPRFVGSGYWGRAYLTDAGRVLKITSDQNEVAIAARFKKLAARPHIVGIYDVRPITPQTAQVGSNDWDTQTFMEGFYVIHMDAVTPLEKYKDGALAKVWEDEFLQMYFLRDDETDKILSHRFEPIAKAWGVEEEFHRLVSQRQKILQDARALGLKRAEAHAGNIGFNKHGNFVFYDMQGSGYSDRPNPNNLGRPVDLIPGDTRYDWTGIFDVV